MRGKTSILIVLILLLVQCKSSGVAQGSEDSIQSTPIILLLEEDLSPSDIEAIKLSSSENAKRISKSQNQWMVKVEGDKENAVKLIESLKKDKRILKVGLQEVNPESEKLKNTKSGKSSPIKN